MATVRGYAFSPIDVRGARAFLGGMASTRDQHMKGRQVAVTVAVALVILGCTSVVIGLVGSPWFFIGGLGALGLGAVLLKFGESADWWPGLRVKGF